MRLVSFFTLLAIVLAGPALRAQQPLILAFPATSCDSIRCDALEIDTAMTDQRVIVSWSFRDGDAFVLDSTALKSDTIGAGEHLLVPVCFRPGRRGQITDSLTVIFTRPNASDTVRIRLTGMGIGPELAVSPTALNFPRTNPPGSSIQRVVVRNIGELPFDLNASSLTLPPPFRLVTPVPFTINAGDSVVIEIAFEPTEKGIFSGLGTLLAGCSLQYELGLNGATDLIGLGAVLRVSKAGFNPVNNEETPCDVSRCTDVTLSNAGNADLTIERIAWGIDTAGYTITTSVPLPLLIEPGGQRVITVCLASRNRGRLRDTLVITSNSRTSIAVGMLMDVSRSMDSVLYCRTQQPKRITEALFQAQNFVARTLLHLPNVGIQDQLAIMKFSDRDSIKSIFNLQWITETSRAAAQAALGTLTTRGGTYTNTALSRLIDTVAKSPLQNRVIVLLSDGAVDFRDNATTPAQLIARANARAIRIFTIGIGTDRNRAARDYLLNLARGTNGEFFDGNSCDSLQDAFETITDLVSRGTIMREPFAMKVTAPFIIASGDVVFDSTYFQFVQCKSVTLTNVGEGAADIDSVMLRDVLGATTSEFYFGPAVRFPIRIAESGQESVEICFQPQRLRRREGAATLTYNSCAPHIVRSGLLGTGWARAGLRVNDTTVGLPGTTVTMPVHLDTSLALYEVDTVRFSLRWNKTMLDFRGVRPGTATSAVQLSGPIVFGTRDARADFVAIGGFTGPIGPLAQLEFTVLRGDSLASEITLTGARFEDDNPRALLRNAGLVAFDSTCFRNGRQIQVAGPIARVVVGEPRPSPAARATHTGLSVECDAATVVRVRLHDAAGRVISGPVDRVLPAGTSELDVDLAGTAAGLHYIVVETVAGETAVRAIPIID